MKPWLKLLIPLLGLTLLYGCIQKPSVTPIPVAANQYINLETLDHFFIEGSLSLRSIQGTVSTQFSWLQCGSRYQLQFFGPLHTGIVRLTGQPNGVELQQGKNITRANNAEDLLDQKINLPLPINDFYYWIKALPAPGEKQVRYDTGQKLTQLIQNNWSINFQEYKTFHLSSMGAILLPKRLEFAQQTAAITGKMVIHNWQTPEINACQNF